MGSWRLSSDAITISCVIGVWISTYAYYVEMTLEANPNYKALCDISEHMSCTKVLGSQYGKGFGITEKFLGKNSSLNTPNCLAGIVSYSFLILLNLSTNVKLVKLQLFLTALSNVLSIYLAYILYFILKDFCIVCVSTYVVNAVNLFFTWLKYKSLRCDLVKKKK